MSLKCGIIGLPNIGKSSLFNALTKSDIPAENYPFCTIEPNSGLVQVPDVRLDKLESLIIMFFFENLRFLINRYGFRV